MREQRAKRPARYADYEDLGDSDEDFGEEEKPLPKKSPNHKAMAAAAAVRNATAANASFHYVVDPAKLPPGTVVCVSGTLTHSGMTRKAFENLVVLAGGAVVAAVSARTNLLVCAEAVGDVKAEKAEKMGVQVMQEEEFWATYGATRPGPMPPALANPSAGAPKGRRKQPVDDDYDDDDDDEDDLGYQDDSDDEDYGAPKKKAKRAPARKAAKGGGYAHSEDD